MTVLGHFGNAPFSHLNLFQHPDLGTAGRLVKNAERCEDNVVRQRSTVLRQDQNRIPKRVRDDNVWSFRKRRIPSCSCSETLVGFVKPAHCVILNLVQNLSPKVL